MEAPSDYLVSIPVRKHLHTSTESKTAHLKTLYRGKLIRLMWRWLQPTPKSVTKPKAKPQIPRKTKSCGHWSQLHPAAKHNSNLLALTRSIATELRPFTWVFYVTQYVVISFNVWRVILHVNLIIYNEAKIEGITSDLSLRVMKTYSTLLPRIAVIECCKVPSRGFLLQRLD